MARVRACGVTQYIRLFSDWGGTKLDRLREAGFEVVVLDEGAEKGVSGVDVRSALREGGDWESLVPPGVARVIKSASACLPERRFRRRVPHLNRGSAVARHPPRS